MNSTNTTASAKTDADARSILKAAGMVIRKQEGEYRVTAGTYKYPALSTAQREAMAYYTDNRSDAVNTGLDMAQRLNNTTGSTHYNSSADAMADIAHGLRHEADLVASDYANSL